MKGWDGDSAAPEDEMLSILANLAEGKHIALPNLVEATRQGEQISF
jgi:hypothetical protein